MAKNDRRRFGDRKDGRLIRSLPIYSRFNPYIMATRNDASNFYEEKMEIREVDRCLRRLRVDGYKDINIMHFMIAAYIRLVSMLPGLNRFVAGRRVYAHNDIAVIMKIKRPSGAENAETTIKVFFEPTDTLYDVYRKISEKINEIKVSDENSNSEDIADAISHLPRPLLRAVMMGVRVLDYFGWLPEKMTDLSPYHGTLTIANMGPMKIGPVYHHISNFGTIPAFIAFGAKHHVYELDRQGNMVDHKYVDCKFSIDERAIEGQYFAQAFQAWRYIFQHPEILEQPPTRIVDDIY